MTPFRQSFSEETINQTLLLTYTKARQANTKKWGVGLTPNEPIYTGMSRPGGKSKAPSKDHTPSKRIKRVTGGWIEIRKETPRRTLRTILKDPDEDPEEDLVPSKPYNPEEEVDPEDMDPNDKKDDDSEYTPGDYSGDDQ